MKEILKRQTGKVGV